MEEKQSIAEKNFINVLMISSKTMVTPKEVLGNDSPNKMYNHILSFYIEYNLSVLKTELEALINLIKEQGIYSNIIPISF